MWTFIMAAAWPAIAFNPTAPAPSDYLEKARCLAVLNIASAVPVSEDPEDMSPLLLMRHRVNEAYDRLEHALGSRIELTVEQMENGAEVFEEEQHRWLTLYGEAPDSAAQDAVVKILLKSVDFCLASVPK